MVTCNVKGLAFGDESTEKYNPVPSTLKHRSAQFPAHNFHCSHSVVFRQLFTVKKL